MGTWIGRAFVGLVTVPSLYLLAALLGSLIPVNRGWTEAERGTTIYLADNGVHTDIIMPARVGALDWAPLVPQSDFAAPDPAAGWVAFGSGEERVYLETPRWRDIEPRTIWSGLTGGKRVMHVEWIADPGYAAREIRLRPEEYRRLWAAIRSDFGVDARGREVRFDEGKLHRARARDESQEEGEQDGLEREACFHCSHIVSQSESKHRICRGSAGEVTIW